MTELAYMVREDWGHDGTAMRQQSAVIRDWLGSPPYVFATADRKKYESDHSADREFMTYVVPDADEPGVIDLTDLNELRRTDKTVTHPLIVLHPYEKRDCELLRGIVTAESVAKLFVIVWSPRDMVRTWLDGVGARCDTTRRCPHHRRRHRRRTVTVPSHDTCLVVGLGYAVQVERLLPSVTDSTARKPPALANPRSAATMKL